MQEFEKLIVEKQVVLMKIVTTSGNYEDRSQVVITKTDGAKVVLTVPNADTFLNFSADLQTHMGTPESSHVAVHLESRLTLSKNVGLWLQATDRLCMMVIFLVTIIRLRHLFNSMRAGTNKQRRLD